MMIGSPAIPARLHRPLLGVPGMQNYTGHDSQKSARAAGVGRCAAMNDDRAAARETRQACPGRTDLGAAAATL